MFSRECQVSEEFAVVDGFRSLLAKTQSHYSSLPGQGFAHALTSGSWNAVSCINTALSTVAGPETLPTCSFDTISFFTKMRHLFCAERYCDQVPRDQESGLGWCDLGVSIFAGERLTRKAAHSERLPVSFPQEGSKQGGQAAPHMTTYMQSLGI